MEELKKIAIVGPECSGKSTLASELSKHFKTSYATEIAREFLQDRKAKYLESDLIVMAEQQIEEEKRSGEKASKILFCDTNLLTFIIWSKVKYGRIDYRIQELWNAKDYNLHILCYPDLLYEEDELRESPRLEDRLKLFHLHEEYLQSSDSNYVVIKGIGEERLNNAMKAIDKLFS